MADHRQPIPNCQEMALGFYGLANFYLVSHLVSRDCNPDRSTARCGAYLFLTGAGSKTSGKKMIGKTKAKKRGMK